MGEKYGKILKFDKPADDFRSAFPLGNGKIGAMVFGGLHKERVILSDATLWSGSDSYEYPDDVYKVLPKIEKLVLEGRYKEAQDLYISDFLAFRPMPMDGANCGSLPYGCLQTMGDLELFFFQYGSRLNQEWYPYELERWLDLEEGTANYRHRSYWETNTPGYDKGMYYDRKALVSRKYNCFAMRISATSAGSIGFNARLSRTENYEVTAVSDDTIIMEGQLEDGHGRGGVRYACCVRIVPEGENAYTEANGTVLRVRRADAAVIYVTTATDMKSFGAPCIDDVRAAVLSDMDLAVNAGWSEIFADHAASHSGYFNRMALQINDIDEELEAMTLDRRLERIGEGLKAKKAAAEAAHADDPSYIFDMQTPGLETPVRDDGLMTLMFNYGRYLLIQAQRIGGMPAAIEGIWCEEIQSPFNGDYHINAQQGTYWHAESCNLPEFHEPYLKLAQALTVNGSDVARKFYNSRGWTAHTITNPWLYALPGGEPHWGGTIVGGAWLCVHLWEHYLYGEDKDYLKEVFPTMKGGALFLLDRLVVDPETGKKVIFPGNTPENFYEDEDGNPLSVSLGTAYDMGITRYLFKAVADAYEVLEAAGMAGDLEADAGSEAGATAASEVEELKAAYDELAYYGINSKGKFMEWQREFTEHKPFHRHISPLWCVYPGCEVSREETPELAEAAMVLLNSRTFTGQMWAMTWRCAVLARLHDGDRIDWILNTLNYFGITANLLSHVYFAKQDETTPETDLQTPFDNKAIFEIDGNTGYSAVVVEMLMQSHRTEDGLRVIELLPSLPSAWKSGSIRGMRARGEIIVDLAWENGELKSAEVTGAAGKKCIVKYKDVKKVIELTGEKVSVVME